MLYLRSLLFNVAFYLCTTILAIGGLPTMFFGRKAILELARVWARATLWLLDAICGVKVAFRGLENLHQEGCIIAAKHQSALETIALVTQVKDFTYILKRELTFIPVFGQYLLRSDQIAINRANRSAAMRDLMALAGKAIAERRAIFIFPEGTRRPPGAPPLYKSGVSRLYVAANAPCVPVALNSGLFWPRRALLRRPGTAVIEFLPAIPAGLPTNEFARLLQDRIEAASDRLIADALAADPRLAPNLGKKDEAAPAAH
ncbi:1-acyl-sn-glycerol-3-phosphate acyltransferase [Rhodoblastus acidophilus]|uniref:1-acyl-sn-glycerol-3-phosphate acyltransferase n=1 Tax=Candidatus Rhodoblastus alkanivorans TaxID=2954117 RepID=A0ABS9Z2Q2_9HYPH|nr:lysophospholipid acyltransferase family protein [Candidatus Rhodoblastus alkanivorans]MCI4678551.1 1-acyl-sn-glycerol-3-phosphate acyltransferase [Candidatus Rhodoblastus alkanivorans]MCI4681361.1 1-acyl-sn-glycerol-3-phosphate acyltransferase [Candidatus Rhodoblastus alkanivorans]MDI4642409.1 1-acyl-sn-glycerol-3-phosphate acyltransferase [Rhodoblastus acidophilus]